MNEQIQEIELKLHLKTKDAYDALVEYIGTPDKIINQVNIFYDTEERLVSHIGYALRLRLESDKAKITLKSTTEQIGSVAMRMEIEESIPIDEAWKIIETNKFEKPQLAPIHALITKGVDIESLAPIVRFANQRQQKEIKLGDENYIFEIDATTYNEEHLIYELEVELENTDKVEKAERDIKNLFAELAIDFVIMKKSKFERALEYASIE